MAAAARFLSEHYGAPAMLMALLIGMAFNFLADHPKTAAGLEATSTSLLRLWGRAAGLSAEPCGSVGTGLAVLCGGGRADGGDDPVRAGPVAAAETALAVRAADRRIGGDLRAPRRPWQSRRSCPKSKQLEQDTLFTVVAVTALSTLAMIFYPALFTTPGMNDAEAGFHDRRHRPRCRAGGWRGLFGQRYGRAMSPRWSKLQRVVMLPVVLLAVLLLSGRGSGRGRIAAPAGILCWAFWPVSR